MRTVRSRVIFFQAMSDPTRQKILSLLEKQERMCVNDIVRSTRASQPTVSKHLTILKNAGLVHGRREGQQVLYSLNTRNLRGYLAGYFSRFSCCADLFHGFTEKQEKQV